MSTKRTAIVAVLALCLLAGAAAARDLDGPGKALESIRRTRCQNNLRHIGALLTMLEAQGKLEYVEGPAFLLQVAPMLKDEELGVFLCSCDPRFPDFAVDPVKAAKAYRENWRTAPCSYLGPDAELLAKLRRGEARDLIVACDADPKRHADGICALVWGGRVEFIRWSEIPVFQGEPIPEVRPGMPDPRRAPPPPEDRPEPLDPGRDELLPRIWAEVQRLRDMRAELEARMRVLEEEFERAAERLKKLAGGEDVSTKPRIWAEIVGISETADLVMLSAGRRQGVKEGAVFRIVKDGETLAHLVVEVVGPDHCAGRVSLDVIRTLIRGARAVHP